MEPLLFMSVETRHLRKYECLLAIGKLRVVPAVCGFS